MKEIKYYNTTHFITPKNQDGVESKENPDFAGHDIIEIDDYISYPVNYKVCYIFERSEISLKTGEEHNTIWNITVFVFSKYDNHKHALNTAKTLVLKTYPQELALYQNGFSISSSTKFVSLEKL